MNTRRLYTKFGHDIARCVTCGLVYANPRASRAIIVGRYSHDYFWNEYLPALGVVGGKFDLAQFDARYAPLLERLAAAPGRRLLEVGAGAGFFLKAAERAGWRATGLELSDAAVQFAREKLSVEVRQEAAESMTLDAGAFDAAVMFDTIEHLFDPRAVLESIRHALVPGGLLLIATPNFRSLSRALLGNDWAVLSPLEHLYYFEEPTLRRLMETSGFGSIRFVRRNAAWNPQQTINYTYTQAPRGTRARATGLLVAAGGERLARIVQAAGRQDILLCFARRLPR
jgi:SAM-dependent methyltransferase